MQSESTLVSEKQMISNKFDTEMGNSPVTDGTFWGFFALARSL